MGGWLLLAAFLSGSCLYLSFPRDWCDTFLPRHSIWVQALLLTPSLRPCLPITKWGHQCLSPVSLLILSSMTEWSRTRQTCAPVWSRQMTITPNPQASASVCLAFYHQRTVTVFIFPRKRGIPFPGSRRVQVSGPEGASLGRGQAKCPDGEPVLPNAQ